MGGRGSGGHNAYRMATEACHKIDAAMLRRAGVLDVDGLKGIHMNFKSGNQSIFKVVVIGGKVLNELEVMIITNNQQNSRQRIRTSTTPCNFGKSRYWLHCPWCGRRCFTLYYSPKTYLREIQAHLFLCRHCRGLTYEARQKRGADLYESRAIHAKTHLRAWAQAHGVPYEHNLSSWSEPPQKPAGMRQSTFAKYEARWEKAVMLAEEEFFRRAAVLM